MKAICLLSLICLFLVSLTGAALAQEYVFQYGLDGYEETMDTHITEYSGNNTNNMGGHTENECCEYDPANTDGKSFLIWFDVSSLPTNTVIGEAILELYMTSTRNGTNEKSVAAHRLLKEWAEGTGTGIDGRAATQNEVCGQWTGMGETWAKFGADEPGEDFAEEANDTIQIAGDIGKWYEWDITKMCQYWINHTNENFGAILLEPRPHAQTLGTKVFATRENATASNHPILRITATLAVDSKFKVTSTWGMIKSEF